MRVAVAAMDMLEVDPNGFDAMDRRLLLTIIDKFDGGPVGVESLAAAVGEERGTIEDVLEPYLIQQGFMMRTARGRVATRNAYLHFGLQPPPAEPHTRTAAFRADSAKYELLSTAAVCAEYPSNRDTREATTCSPGRFGCTTRTPMPRACRLLRQLL